MNRKEHLITILKEECLETGMRASKVIRFGFDEVQPDQSLTNRERLIYEFNDLYAMMEMLKEEGFIDRIVDREMITAKKKKVEEFLEYSKKCGTLTKSKE